MKLRLLFYTLLIFVGVIMSACGDDDDDDAPPPHEVGIWDLKNYALINVPADYASNEGRRFELNQVNLGIESYELNLEASGTFSRDINFTGVIPQEDMGTWAVNEGELTLDSNDFDDNESFGIEKNESDDLWLSFPLQFSLIQDDVLDTLTQEYADSLTDEEFSDLFDPVNVDFVFLFERDE